jgi:hypothetical protein
MAKYPYIVVKDGKWYPAGADVPAKPANANEGKPEQSKSTKK